MLLATLAVLVGTITAATVPQPKLKQLQAGGIELSVDDVPGLMLKHLKYITDNDIYFGTFYQAADGRWYHKKEGVDYKNNKVHYSMLGELNGKPVFREGTVVPEQFQIAFKPPERLRRAGNVVMRDNFDGSSLNTNFWNYEVSMYGGYNWEIQVYTKDSRNIYLKNGNLYIRPTLTSEKFGEAFLHNGVLDVAKEWGECTNADRYGCHREGRYGLLPPIMSGKLKSKPTIRFGKACARAKIPRGDWIWPAIWMLPRDSEYGQWPRSGEIDLMESRGNAYARSPDGSDHGVNQVGSTMHWGPDAGQNKFYLTHGDRDSHTYATTFHDYCVDWTVDHIIVTVNGQEVLHTHIDAGGFWSKGGFSGSNPWAGGTKAAPFDKPFYFILNVAVGGTSGFFPDDWSYSSRKPYDNNSQHELDEFWAARHDWLPSWNGEDVAMVVDYVEMIQY